MQVFSFRAFFGPSPCLSHRSSPVRALLPSLRLGVISFAAALSVGPATVVLTSSVAVAAPSSAEIECLTKLNKAGASVFKAQAKATAGCLKAGAKGALAGPALTICLRDDLGGGVQKARDKADAIAASVCDPAPSFGFPGAAEVSNAAVRGQLGLMEAGFGTDFSDVTIHKDSDATGAKCQAGVKKVLDKTVAFQMKAFGKCADSGLDDGSITDASGLGACLAAVASDEGGKLAKAHGKIAKTLTKKCAGVDVEAAFPGSCGDASEPDLCFAQLADCRSCLMLAAIDGLDEATANCDAYDDGLANLSCSIACNGSPHLCDRSYEDVVFATSHNAMSNAEDGWLAPNNSFSVPSQMAAGIRALMLDTWYFDGNPVLCHGGQLAPGIGCDITGMRPLVPGLADLDTFLDENPNEILSIIFESYISEADTEAAFIASGLIDHVHVQSPGDPWPTLREMIEAGTRLVVFTDDSGVALPWHHYVWSHAWETHFSNSEPEDFSCAPNRGSTSNDLFILNHFLTSPFASPDLAMSVNFNPFFLDRAQLCQSEASDLPNFVTVDFEDIGDLYEVVRELNGLP